MTEFETKFQIGKSGVTENVITSLKNSLKTHKQIRINVLKSFCRNKGELKQIAEKIISKIEKPKCNFRVIGYTILLRKK
jgi:RNA-binding protein YhbY